MKRKQGRPPKTGKGKSSLSRDRIESTALRRIDERGIEEFSMRLLASELGCEPMSLYHHFPSRAHLMDALVDRIVSEMPLPDPELPWRQRITEAARGYRAAATRHPRFFPYLATHRMNTPKALGYLDGVVRIFRDGGFEPEAAALYFRIVSNFLMGATLDETMGYEAGPSAAEAPSEAEQARDFPALAEVGEYFTPDRFDAVFESGLGLLLREIESLRAREV